jgi:hypothetical protein
MAVDILESQSEHNYHPNYGQLSSSKHSIHTHPQIDYNEPRKY